MIQALTFHRAGFDLLLQLFKSVVLLSLLSAVTFVSAQTTSPTDGTTPSGLSPGVPAGSYSLSGFDNVNLYNGNLNFSLPLLGIGGRGGAKMTSTYSLDSVKWTVEKEVTTVEGGGGCLPASEEGCYRPPYTGGETYITVFYPNHNFWEGIRPGYGPGVLQGRYGVTKYTSSQNVTTLTRLTFTSFDGTEYELRDVLTDGQAYTSPPPGGTTRGHSF